MTSCGTGHPLGNVEIVFRRDVDPLLKMPPWVYEAMGPRGEGGEPPASQGLPGWWLVLLWPLKNQPPPLPFLFPFQFASLHFLLVTSVTLVFLHVLLVFVLRQTQPLELFPKQLARCLEAQPPSGAAEGSSEDEHGRGGVHSGHQSGFPSVASVGEQLSSALHLGPFMKRLSHSEQCHLPGPASSSDVQDLPPACSMTLAIALPCLSFLGTSTTTARAHLRRVGIGVESLN